MPGLNTTERTTMAKVQKGLLLNEELAQLIDAIANTTGASFTKIVTAALVQHLLGDLGPPRPRWMRLAVALEHGDLDLRGVLHTIQDEKLADCEANLEYARRCKWNEAITDTHLAWCDDARSMRMGRTLELRKILDDLSSDPLEAIIARWTHLLNAWAEPPIPNQDAD